MKSKSLIMLFVSLGFGLIAAIGISQVMGRNRGNPDAAIPKVPVVVAMASIDHESVLDEKTIQVFEWPVNIVPEDALHDLKDLENMVVASRVLKGMPICKSNLINKNQVQKLPIPPGKKVIAIPLDAEDTIGGLMQPGDRVDIVGVFMEKNRGIDVSTPRTFLKNIQVFSVGESFVRDPLRESTGSKGKENVGVLVTEKESEILTLALGSRIKLKFVMRADTGEVESEIVESFPETSGTNKRPDKSLTSILGEMLDQSGKTGLQTVIYNGSDRQIVRFDSKGQVIEDADSGSGSPLGSNMPPPPAGGDITDSDLTGGEGSGSSNSGDYRFEQDQYPGG